MRSKYNAKKVVSDGITFDSMKEANRYHELKLMERAGLIKDLELQPEYELICAYTRQDGKKIQAIRYLADFRYLDMRTSKRIVEDVKGMKTQVYLIKKKLLLWRYPDINFIET